MMRHVREKLISLALICHILSTTAITIAVATATTTPTNLTANIASTTTTAIVVSHRPTARSDTL